MISPKHANFIENAGGATHGRRARADGRGAPPRARAVRRRARARGRAPRRHSSCLAVGQRGRRGGEVGTRGRSADRVTGAPCARVRRPSSQLPARARRGDLPRAGLALARLRRARSVLGVALARSSRSAAYARRARQRRLFAVDRARGRWRRPAHVAQHVTGALAARGATSLLALDLAELAGRVERAARPSRSARFDRAFPHTLRVTVVAERPVAVLRRGAASWLVAGQRPGDRSRSSRGARPALPRIWVRPDVDARASASASPARAAARPCARRAARRAPLPGPRSPRVRATATTS